MVQSGSWNSPSKDKQEILELNARISKQDAILAEILKPRSLRSTTLKVIQPQALSWELQSGRQVCLEETHIKRSEQIQVLQKQDLSLAHPSQTVVPSQRFRVPFCEQTIRRIIYWQKHSDNDDIRLSHTLTAMQQRAQKE